MLKQLTSVIKNENLYKKSDTTNYEGFPAFKRKGIERLKEILFLGHVGNTFYVSCQKNIAEKIKSIEQLISEIDPDISSKLIVSARNEGLFRHIPIIALIYLKIKSPKHFKDIFNDVIITGQDLSDYLDLSRAVGIKWGKSAKKAMHKWLETKVTPFYCLKYRKQIADAIAISRPEVDVMPNSNLLKYAYNIKKKIKVDINSMQIFHAEEFKKNIKQSNIQQALYHAKMGNLPADLMIALIGKHNDPEIWKVIVQNMGVMQFLKYLNKLAQILSQTELLSYMEDKLTIDNISKAKIFPYSIFTAWTYTQNNIVKNYLEKLLEQYIYKFDAGVWGKHTYFIAPDISGSMNGKPSKIAGFFAGVLGKRFDEHIYMWNTSVQLLDIQGKSVADICDSIVSACSGGTSMYKPIEYAIDNEIYRDVFFIITDNEHWYGDKTFMEEWINYKKMNSSAKAVIIEVMGYGSSQVDEDFAEKYNVYTVFGWSDNIFKWIEMKILS